VPSSRAARRRRRDALGERQIDYRRRGRVLHLELIGRAAGAMILYSAPDTPISQNRSGSAPPALASSLPAHARLDPRERGKDDHDPAVSGANALGLFVPDIDTGLGHA